MKRILFILPLVLLFQACMARLSGSPVIPNDAIILRQVPLYEDTSYQCGPSTLAAVMNYWAGKDHSISETAPEKISSDIYSSGARGVLGMDIERYAQKHGFQTRQYSGSTDDLRQNVLRGVPPVILVDHGMSFYQKNHFVVVTGYSSTGVVLHSGAEEIFMPFDTLEEIWRKTDHWTLLVQPPQ